MAKSPGPPKKKKRVRRTPEEARALILKAAQKVLAELGPDRAGLKDVAGEAGVSHALITHYFGTMDGLIEATIEEHAKVMRTELVERAAGIEMSPAKLSLFAMEMMSDPVYSRLVIWAAMSKRMANEDFFPRREMFAKRIADALDAHRDKDRPEMTREEIESLMVAVWCAGFGYSIVREHLWEAFGKKSSSARDKRFYKFVANMVARYVGADELD
ncbi:MAG: TetR family transcriptional regulator [Deltaproteobacteria bacterium]|nr:TetR family transcriptional regulator [Deltaproteobacteria bacterium]